ALQLSMGDEVREYFEIDAEGSFSTDVLVLWAER
ncbi:SAM-dependent methyltransferase, partial [Pseudomonas sp. ATCC 13867]